MSWCLNTCLVFIILSPSILVIQSEQPVIFFSQEWYSGQLNEKQPIGTEVVEVYASYFTAEGEFRTDGTFQIKNDGDGKFFKVVTTSDDSISAGSVESAVAIDKNTANKTEFLFPIWYTTPVNYSADAQVHVYLKSNYGGDFTKT